MSNSTSTPKQPPKFDHNSALHQPFSWFSDDAKDYPMAAFVALTMDVCAGINTCLEIINSSELDRTYNLDADPGDEVAPAVTSFDSSRLLRLSIAASSLLESAAERKIAWINEYGPKELRSKNGGEV